jgi:membrane protease YdiL (CAAX protease family)
MSSRTTDSSLAGLTERLQSVIQGDEDQRLRALWRVLLATQVILVTGAVSRVIAGGLGRSGWLVVGLLQAATFGVVLVAWARYVDRRPVSEYGMTASARWFLDVAVAFLAILFAQSVWYGMGDALGLTSVAVAGTPPEGTLVTGLATAFVAIGVNVWVQETAYFGLVLRNAAEGLHARELTARQAVFGGWVVGALYVVAVHSGSLQRPGLFVAGAVYGLLYVHTGSLALPVGFHFGVNYTGGWVFAPASAAAERATVFAVTREGALYSTLSGPGIPQMVIAYLLLLGWLRYRGESVGIRADIARWTPR